VEDIGQIFLEFAPEPGLTATKGAQGGTEVNPPPDGPQQFPLGKVSPIQSPMQSSARRDQEQPGQEPQRATSLLAVLPGLLGFWGLVQGVAEQQVKVPNGDSVHGG
jgi:hypothetical protein